jgi:hypothetical protein
MQIPNEMAIDSRPLLPSQIHPVKHCINFAVFDPANRPQAIALDHHRYRLVVYFINFDRYSSFQMVKP